MSPAAIEVDRLTKRYGLHAAIDGVSFRVARGEVVGFLGPNGAGKSTTLRILAGSLGASSGRAFVDGHDVVDAAERARRSLGYMPENVPLYGEMRVREYLRFRADLKKVARKERAAAVDRAMELARVDDVASTVIEHLSKGYRQRVGLADALVAKPPVLILDEPTSGLDPNQIREVRALIKGLGGEQTVLLSTHILSEVEATCARVIVIDRGRIVAEGTPKSLAKRRARPRVEVLARGDGALPEIEGVVLVKESAEGSLRRLVFDVKGELGEGCERIVGELGKAGLFVRELVPQKTSLEDVFATVTHADELDEEPEEPTEAPPNEEPDA